MLYFWKVKLKSFFIMKGEIRNISGIGHSQAFIWASADINLCSQAAKVAMSVRTLLKPCVSHRGRFLSSKGALLRGSMGEAAKESSSFACQLSSVSGITGWGSVSEITGSGSVSGITGSGSVSGVTGSGSGITEALLQPAGHREALLPQDCPSARLRHVCLEAEKHFWNKNFTR